MRYFKCLYCKRNCFKLSKSDSGWECVIHPVKVNFWLTKSHHVEAISFRKDNALICIDLVYKQTSVFDTSCIPTRYLVLDYLLDINPQTNLRSKVNSIMTFL